MTQHPVGWRMLCALCWLAYCYAGNVSTPCRSQVDQLACENSTKCYLPIQRCDGDKDCPLGDDERNCSVKKSAPVSRCGRADFPCKNGIGCLPWNLVCNEEKNCMDGSDESEMACVASFAHAQKFGRTCLADETLCNVNKNQCISSALLCDGQKDCADGSDELGCAADKQRCHFNCLNGTGCVVRQQICNGFPDCADKSDELHCFKRCQHPDQLPCQRNQSKIEDVQQHNSIVDFIASQVACYSQVQKCDGVPHCPNNADEEDCPISCAQNQFACEDGRQCVATNRTCDGIPDCLDHSDEFTCSAKAERCDPKNSFECPHSNGSVFCIPRQKVCDRIEDCMDGRDERSLESARNCLKNPCQNNNGGCEQICVNYFGVAECMCKKGFRLHGNGQNCVDIDECAEWGRCPQNCQNSRGSYHCSCRSEYHYNDQSNTCEPEVTSPLAILYNTPQDIRLYFIHSTKISTLHPLLPQYPLVSMDYGLRGNQLTVFWVEDHDHSCLQSITITNLLHANVNSITVHPPVPISPPNHVNGISFDGINNLLFWLSDDGVFVMNAENRQWTQIVSMHGLGRAIVAVPQFNHLYFVNVHSSELLQSTLDGENIKPVHFLEDPEFVRYLAWDVSMRRITWLDESRQVIYSLDPINHDLQSLELGVAPHSRPSGFSMFNENYFWSDTADQGSIHSISKFPSPEKTGNRRRRYTDANVDWHAHGMQLHLVHPYNRPLGYSFCYQHSCSHICLPHQSKVETVARHRCACPLHMTLNSDGRTCNETSDGVETVVLHHHHVIEFRSTKIIPEPAKGLSSYWLLIIFILVAFVVIGIVIISRGQSNRPLRQLQATVSAKFQAMRTCNKTQSIHFDNPIYEKAVLSGEDPQVEHKLLEL